MTTDPTPTGPIVNQQPDGKGSVPPQSGLPQSSPQAAGPLTGSTLDHAIQLLGTLNVAIPVVFGTYRVIRDLVRSHNPNAPALSDEQLITLMSEKSDRIVARADEFIKSGGDPSLRPPIA